MVNKTSLAVFLGFLSVTSACRPMLKPLPANIHKDFATALNDMQWYSEAYGFGGMSAPLLVEPSAKFQFNPADATPDSFFRAARDNVGMKHASSYQDFIGGGIGLSASVDFLALQQYLASQSSTNRDTNLVAEKQRLLTEAANREFQAAMTAAQTIQDPVKRQEAEASAYRALAANLPGPTSAPATTTSATTPTSAGTGIAAPNAAAVLGSLQAQSLYAAGTPGVSNDMRSALLTAAGDTAINAILSMLGKPDEAKNFKDKTLLFAVTEVSVNPGWLTRKHFSADVTSQITLDYMPAGRSVQEIFIKASKDKSLHDHSVLEKLQNCLESSREENVDKLEEVTSFDPDDQYSQEQFRPYLTNGNKQMDLFVSAVSPMSESQMLDLQGSIQKRREFALRLSMALSYAGMKGAADSFMNWARQTQQDAQSRTANVVVNSYSLSGGMFGFHIGPTLSANPGSNSAVKEELGRQSFPALLLIGFDKEEVRPLVEIRKTVRNGAKHQVCRLMEPRISLNTFTQWRPLDGNLNSSLKPDELLRVRKSLNTAFDKIRACNQGDGDKRSVCERECLTDSEACITRCENDIRRDCKTVKSTDRQMYEKLAALYRSRVNGNEYSFSMPTHILSSSMTSQTSDKGTPAPPEVKEIIPTKVQVAAPSKAATAGTRVELVLIGKGLGKVARTKIEPVIGKVTWVNGQGADQVTPNAEMVGDSIKLIFRVSGDDPVIVFALPSGDSKVLTPPLAVSVAAAPVPAKSSTISIERKQKDGNSETYTFSPDVSDDVKKAVVEKDKPRVISVKKDETTATSTTATPAK